MPHQMIVQSLYEIGAIQFGEFTLKSGKISPIYLNLRKIISYPALLASIANAMWQRTAQISFDVICGVPYTALPIATCMSLEHNIPMIMRRKEKKDYGTKQMIEGVFEPGQQVLVIEDVITTGSSILETVNDIETVGLQVNHIIALIDREQGGKDNLQSYGLQSLFTLSHLLNYLLKLDVALEEKEIIYRLLEKKSSV